MSKLQRYIIEGIETKTIIFEMVETTDHEEVLLQGYLVYFKKYNNLVKDAGISSREISWAESIKHRVGDPDIISTKEFDNLTNKVFSHIIRGIPGSSIVNVKAEEIDNRITIDYNSSEEPTLRINYK